MQGLFDILRGAESKSAKAEVEAKAEDDSTAPQIVNGRLLVFKKFAKGHHSEF
jgi:hypothetical protein